MSVKILQRTRLFTQKGKDSAKTSINITAVLDLIQLSTLLGELHLLRYNHLARKTDSQPNVLGRRLTAVSLWDQTLVSANPGLRFLKIRLKAEFSPYVPAPVKRVHPVGQVGHWRPLSSRTCQSGRIPPHLK